MVYEEIIFRPEKARTILEKADAGVWLEAENPEALAKTLEELSSQRDLCKVMGQNGRSFVEQHYSRQVQAQQLAELLSTVLEASN